MVSNPLGLGLFGPTQQAGAGSVSPQTSTAGSANSGSAGSFFGSPFSSPFSSPFNSLFSTSFGSPFGSQSSSPFGSQFNSPFGSPFGGSTGFGQTDIFGLLQQLMQLFQGFLGGGLGGGLNNNNLFGGFRPPLPPPPVFLPQQDPYFGTPQPIPLPSYQPPVGVDPFYGSPVTSSSDSTTLNNTTLNNPVLNNPVLNNPVLNNSVLINPTIIQTGPNGQTYTYNGSGTQNPQYPTPPLPNYFPPNAPPTPGIPGGYNNGYPGYPGYNNAPPVYIPPGIKPYVWGDPHFVGFFNGVKETDKTGDLNGNGKVGDTVSQKYDFQGKAGETYNVLSDSGLSVNGKVESWKGGDATVFKQAGVTVRGADGQIYRVHADTTTDPNVVMPNGQTVTLQDGKTVQLGGADQSVTYNKGAKSVDIKASEYDVSIKKNAEYLDIHATPNAGFDGRNHDGLLGVSGRPDIIGKVQNGTGAQGKDVVTKGDKGGANRTGADYTVTNVDAAPNSSVNTFNTAKSAPVGQTPIQGGTGGGANATAAKPAAAEAKPAAAAAGDVKPAAAPEAKAPAPAAEAKPAAKPVEEPAKK